MICYIMYLSNNYQKKLLHDISFIETLNLFFLSISKLELYYIIFVLI